MIVAAITLYFIIKYVRDTAAMAVATRDSADATRNAAKAAEATVKEMQAAREEENAPFVVVYFNYVHSRHQSLYLVVENIGKRIARDIRLEFTPPLQVSQFNKDTLESNTLLKNGIKSLVPNYKIPIPFDYLMHYMRAKLPMEYTVKVTYRGNPSLPPIELEYPLDLNHFQYIHFVTETGLGEIDNTLHQLADNLSSYTSNAEGANSLLNQIANGINRGIIIKNRVTVGKDIPNIPSLLREFVFLWVMYGKQREKFNRSFLFGLRAKAVLISEELLNIAVALDSQAWVEQLKQIISNLSQLGSMELVIDGPHGVMFTMPHFVGGSSKEDFDNLGDAIVTDIRTVVELIEKEQKNPLNEDTQEEAQLPGSSEETD